MEKSLNKKISVLLVDDDQNFRKVLSRELSLAGFKVICASSGEEVDQKISVENIDVVLLDIKMPGRGGIETLRSIKELRPFTEVIILTAYGSLETAITSLKLGAYDYLCKPCNLDELETVIQKAYEKKQLVQQNISLKRELNRRDKYNHFIGNSPEIKTVLDLVSKVAPTNSTVLIQGESGVGKELIARLIHQISLRKDKPFVIVDCCSLHENLLQSELFGHEKGAYTGAIALKHGLFEVADSGSIFLDEIGEIKLTLQAKLLRVLESGSFRRLGGTRDIKVDVRIIAATNKDLQQMMKERDFREDLFYRLNVISIYLPPLRERKKDIPLLAKHFVENINLPRKEKKEISRETMTLLMNYKWPGNVRELENVIERALILSEDETIQPKDLPYKIKMQSDFFKEDDLEASFSLEELEKKYIKMILEKSEGHRGKAAKILNVSERNLYRKIKKYNI